MTYYDSPQFKNKHKFYIIVALVLLTVALVLQYGLGIDINNL